MEYLVIIQVFSTYICSIILFFFPSFITYKQFALLLAVITALSLAIIIVKRKGIIPLLSVKVLAAYSFILIGYYFFTPHFYTCEPRGSFSGQFLSILGQVLPGAITATFVAEDYDTQTKVKQLLPYVASLFSVIAMLCNFTNILNTSSLLLNDINGLNYQTTAYIASYATAFLCYYLLTRNEFLNIGIFRLIYGKVIAYILIILNLITILKSGGRGGFVAYFFFLGMTVLLAIKRFSISIKSVVHTCAIAGMCILVAGIVIRYAMNSILDSFGFKRILSFLSTPKDVGRKTLYSQALVMWKNKPLFGNGFGSVFFEIGNYSHNLFTDSLAETGIVGTILFVAILMYSTYCIYQLLKKDYTDLIWLYVFFCGFLLGLFSGYYLTHIPMWWALFFVIERWKYINTKHSKFHSNQLHVKM